MKRVAVQAESVSFLCNYRSLSPHTSCHPPCTLFHSALLSTPLTPHYTPSSLPLPFIFVPPSSERHRQRLVFSFDLPFSFYLLLPRHRSLTCDSLSLCKISDRSLLVVLMLLLLPPLFLVELFCSFIILCVF